PADIILEEARPDRLVNLVSPSPTVALQRHAIPARRMREIRLTSPVGDRRAAGAVALDRGVSGQGIHPAVRMSRPGLMVARMTLLARLGPDVIAWMDVTLRASGTGLFPQVVR